MSDLVKLLKCQNNYFKISDTSTKNQNKFIKNKQLKMIALILNTSRNDAS